MAQDVNYPNQLFLKPKCTGFILLSLNSVLDASLVGFTLAFAMGFALPFATIDNFGIYVQPTLANNLPNLTGELETDTKFDEG